jgi:hypothetical protein
VLKGVLSLSALAVSTSMMKSIFSACTTGRYFTGYGPAHIEANRIFAEQTPDANLVQSLRGQSHAREIGAHDDVAGKAAILGGLPVVLLS